MLDQYLVTCLQTLYIIIVEIVTKCISQSIAGLIQADWKYGVEKQRWSGSIRSWALEVCTCVPRAGPQIAPTMHVVYPLGCGGGTRGGGTAGAPGRAQCSQSVAALRRSSTCRECKCPSNQIRPSIRKNETTIHRWARTTILGQLKKPSIFFPKHLPSTYYVRD